MTREIQVDSDWLPSGVPRSIGCLSVEIVRGKESYSFSYDPNWLNNVESRNLDPDLQWFVGRQYPSAKNQQGFGIFLDSAPDRWGRVLMQRREAHSARIANRQPKKLLESDFLIGVHDEQRLGGIRLRFPDEADYLSHDASVAAPPWALLRELEQASWEIQSDKELSQKKMSEVLRLLVAPGSSIGGARPKAGIVDQADNLWIAKFPGRDDDRDVGAWEQVAIELAGRAGVCVSNSRLESFGKRSHRTFLTQRFDRRLLNGKRKRTHFASAMTLLGYSDGDGASTGASYLELAQWITQNQLSVDADLEQLWRRIIFSIMIHNTDDHLRNHGFLLTDNGWRLSPAFDLNPDPNGTGLALNISELDNALDLDLARQVAPYFRLEKPAAETIIAEVAEAVSHWRAIATQYDISRAEQNRMQPAFALLPTRTN
jgi:serine/threonine-protein kinase HipA